MSSEHSDGLISRTATLGPRKRPRAQSSDTEGGQRQKGHELLASSLSPSGASDKLPFPFSIILRKYPDLGEEAKQNSIRMDARKRDLCWGTYRVHSQRPLSVLQSACSKSMNEPGLETGLEGRTFHCALQCAPVHPPHTPVFPRYRSSNVLGQSLYFIQLPWLEHLTTPQPPCSPTTEHQACLCCLSWK